MMRAALQRLSATLAASFSLALFAAMPAAAQITPEIAKHPGFVDGSSFSSFGDREAVKVTEISIAGPVITALSRRMLSTNPEAAQALNEIVAVHAVILEDLEDPERTAAREQVFRLAKRLADTGWQRIARVREADSRVEVLVRYEGETRVAGLTVLIAEAQEVTFVNLVGSIDLASLAVISEAIDLPGLDAVPPK